MQNSLSGSSGRRVLGSPYLRPLAAGLKHESLLWRNAHHYGRKRVRVGHVNRIAAAGILTRAERISRHWLNFSPPPVIAPDKGVSPTNLKSPRPSAQAARCLLAIRLTWFGCGNLISYNLRPLEIQTGMRFRVRDPTVYT